MKKNLISSMNRIDCKSARTISLEDSGTVPEMLTAKDLEVLLKIDVKTIYSYVQRGLIPYVKIQSNVRFVKQQIVEWLERQNFQPRSVNRADATKSRGEDAS